MLSSAHSQKNMDWVFHWVLIWLQGIPWLLVLYDIMCQYSVNLRRRFTESPALSWPQTLKTFLTGIGQFNIHGHRASCFARYSVNFILGAGYQDGEILETLWMPLGAAARGALGMTLFHRREVIDDHMNHSNWTKVTRIGSSTPFFSGW